MSKRTKTPSVPSRSPDTYGLVLVGPLCAVPKNRDSAFFNLGTVFCSTFSASKKKSQGSTYYNKPPPFPFLPTTSSPLSLSSWPVIMIPHLAFYSLLTSYPPMCSQPIVFGLFLNQLKDGEFFNLPLHKLLSYPKETEQL